jgi:hypothetical protein
MIEKHQKQDVTAQYSEADIVTGYEYNLDFNIPIKITLPNGLETLYSLNELGDIISSESSEIYS